MSSKKGGKNSKKTTGKNANLVPPDQSEDAPKQKKLRKTQSNSNKKGKDKNDTNSSKNNSKNNSRNSKSKNKRKDRDCEDNDTIVKKVRMVKKEKKQIMTMPTLRSIIKEPKFTHWE